MKTPHDYFKVSYTIYNVDGTIRKEGTICKVMRHTLKRMDYLKRLYGSLVEFK